MNCDEHKLKGQYPKDAPFYCEVCGGFDFPYTPVGDKVFILPEIPKTFNSGVIIVPEQSRDIKDGLKTNKGIVLGVGKGFWKASGKFKPTQVKAGDTVYYDKTVPWTFELEDRAGVVHSVLIAGEQDVYGLTNE